MEQNPYTLSLDSSIVGTHDFCHSVFVVCLHNLVSEMSGVETEGKGGKKREVRKNEDLPIGRLAHQV